jgi:hypothetical protein
MTYDRSNALAGELVHILKDVQCTWLRGEPADLQEAFADRIRGIIADIELEAAGQRLEGID